MISDPNDEHRYFLSLLVSGDSSNCKIFGLFVYFDSHGNVSNLVIIPKLLLQYDLINGTMDEANTFLYNQTLVFIKSRNDTRGYMITVCCFDYYDNFLGNHTDYSKILTKYFSQERIFKQYNRFLKIIDYSDNIHIIDMGSTRVLEEKMGHGSNLILKYSMYKNDNSVDIEKLILNVNEIPEQKYSDGYETNCIKCGLRTSRATFYEDNTYLNLGNSYCHDCGIRYSKSECTWVCCKLALQKEPYLTANFCRNKVRKETCYNCELEHDTREFIFDYILVEKKPYKKSGSVTISS